MVTYWRTEPIMDNPLLRPSAQRLHRPQVFVRVEFGVSWSPGHSPRSHAVQYRTRGLRDRSPNFPRQVAAPNTNYLAAASIQQFQHHQVEFSQRSAQQSQPRHQDRNQQRSLQQPPVQPQSSRRSSPQPHPQHPKTPPNPRRPRGFLQEPEGFQESRRSSRSSRSSHDRGRSAPPPLSDNNWDVVRPKASAHASAGPSALAGSAARANSNAWKALPDVPTSYRLGEDGMPWDTWSFPMGWEPFMEPDDLIQHSSDSSQDRQPARQRHRAISPPVNSVEAIPVYSPFDQTLDRQQDPARRYELNALGSAMMTIDNGFENQWWNQGERISTAVEPKGDTVVAIHPPPPAASSHREQMSLGWATALPQGAADERLSFSTANNMVSPVSSCYGSPGGHAGLSRTLSTRSEELWLTSERYAR